MKAERFVMSPSFPVPVLSAIVGLRRGGAVLRAGKNIQGNPEDGHGNPEAAKNFRSWLGVRLMKMLQPLLLAGVLMGLPVSAVPAAPMTLSPYALGGTSESNGWLTINGSIFPGTGSFPGTTMWSPLGSTTGGDAVLAKISNGTGGGPYAASGSMYFGGFSGDPNVHGGTLAAQDLTPVADLSNIVFQIQIGEAATYDFYNGVLPTLSYTTSSGTTGGLVATDTALLEQYFNGTVTMPTGEEPLYINTYALQWDLSGVSEEITAFSISFTGVQHAQLYAMQLDQNSTYVQAVPEPAGGMLLGLGSLLVVWRSRRRQEA